MQFSMNLQLYKMIHCMYSTMDSQFNCPPFQIVFTNTTSDLYGMVGWGWWSGGLNNMSSIHTFYGAQLSPIVAPNVTKVAKSQYHQTAVWQFTATSSFINSQHGPLQTTGHSWMSDTACKPAPVKADQTAYGIDTHMDYQCIDVAIEWWQNNYGF